MLGFEKAGDSVSSERPSRSMQQTRLVGSWDVDAPAIRYAQRGDATLAYQVAGTGTPLLLVGGAACLSATWEDPLGSRFLRELASRFRTITFDQRGAGRSDPLPTAEPLPLEERAADALAV